MVAHMTGKYGKTRSLSQLMLTGNGRGLAGFSICATPAGGKGGNQKFQKAVNKAGLRLTHIDLYEGRTGRKN